ncbi:hypothetical protein Bca52824_077648 [Brassica carinata]|uniref:Uncharacterized protein n=1 Tax=Brassica carinata TaxID=52824 RepID=A0A8X7PZE7_BRACI|nr:hypothetical protein Bca52824_077648 [Brassica carinata]
MFGSCEISDYESYGLSHIEKEAYISIISSLGTSMNLRSVECQTRNIESFFVQSVCLSALAHYLIKQVVVRENVCDECL